MKIISSLPSHYREHLTLDLEKDKNHTLIIHIISIAILLVMIFGMNFIMPISSLFEDMEGAGELLLRILVLVVLFVCYIVLHEVTHGLTMMALGAKTVSYGFSGLYAYAGCREFFSKGAYLLVSFLPVLLWGVILSVLSYLVSDSWFWIFYILQIVNLSGAAVDLYVGFRFLVLHEEALIYDTGTSIIVYVPMTDEELIS